MELASSRTFGNARVTTLVEVTSRFKKELDPSRLPQFNLAAEEVDKGNPDLVIRDLTASQCTRLPRTSTRSRFSGKGSSTRSSDGVAHFFYVPILVLSAAALRFAIKAEKPGSEKMVCSPGRTAMLPRSP